MLDRDDEIGISIPIIKSGLERKCVRKKILRKKECIMIVKKDLRASLIKDTNNGNIRYYNLQVFTTLFDEYLLERIYGNIRYKSPTGVKKNYYTAITAAKEKYELLLRQKIARGYQPK